MVAGFSKLARAGYVSASAHASSVTNGGVYGICLYHGNHPRGNRSPKCRSGDGGAAHALVSGCKDWLGA